MSVLIFLICLVALMSFSLALMLCLGLNSDPNLGDVAMVTQGRPLTIWAVYRCWIGYLAPWRYGPALRALGRAFGVVRRR